MELVQEIHQVLMDREDTCHRTCFSLQLDGVTLDNFAELKNIEGLKEGSIIKVNIWNINSTTFEWLLPMSINSLCYYYYSLQAFYSG